MVDFNASQVYVGQAVEQMKAAITSGNGADMAAVVNKMARDGYPEEAHHLAATVTMILLEEAIISALSD